MATSEEARDAIIDRIEERAKDTRVQGAEALALAQAWEIVRKRSAPSSSAGRLR